MDCESYRTLNSRDARVFLGFEQDHTLIGDRTAGYQRTWMQYIMQSVHAWHIWQDLLLVGTAAFDAFLQSNVTGPPLSWNSAELIFSSNTFDEREYTPERLRKQITSSLSVDGEAVYQLIPNIELFFVAQCILNNPSQRDGLDVTLWRLRVNTWHQRLLQDISPTLQETIYNDLKLLEIEALIKGRKLSDVSHAQLLIERANIHTYYSDTTKASGDLARAARERSFDFVLTGRLGKRTKFQDKELSQLVVLARSADADEGVITTAPKNSSTYPNISAPLQEEEKIGPQAVDLNDDTLLESISFATDRYSGPQLEKEADLPATLRSLDPGNQPPLNPIDAIILLSTASSITNTSPADGLTREETLPYAERVISGGSSNWQVYTQALLVRSRIEGYRSRTVERGVLQLQALVDQVIADTTPNGHMVQGQHLGTSDEMLITTFLPKPKQAESAPASERLKYIHQLTTPPRWKLESELADRWVSLGALRTALEIFERLQMWAEVALCWAANDQEDKAREIIRDQLFTDTGIERIERNPLPADAPRLFCILADIEKDVAAYERAWQISNCRYARAQRSLAKHFVALGDFSAADEAYVKSLKINPQNRSVWFALGCVRLQAEEWAGAAEAFRRAIDIDENDAESWSNSAVALLNLSSDALEREEGNHSDSGTEPGEGHNLHNSPEADPQRYISAALIAIKQASKLKRDSFRIWQNLLSISVKLSPPPYPDIVIAQTRLIDLLGKSEGEKCVDVDIVEALVAHLIMISPSSSEPSKYADSVTEHGEEIPGRTRGLAKMIIDLVQKRVTPLITSSRRLWLVTAKLSLHLGRPSAALSSYEKAWRTTLNQPVWELGPSSDGAKMAWSEVSLSTIDLADAYESLGERERESGLDAGELVAKDWRFKARSALRSVLARAKDGWEGDADYDNLLERLQELKGA